MNYSRAIHTLHNSLKISVNIFKKFVIMLYEKYKLVKPKQKSPKDELYSEIKAVDRRIDKVLKDYRKCKKNYAKCKNNPIIADVKISKSFDNKINDLVAQVNYEFDNLNYIFYSLDSALNTSISELNTFKSALDTSIIADYDAAEGKLAIINSKLESIEAYCEYIHFCMNSHNIPG